MPDGLQQYPLQQMWDMVRTHDHKYVYRHVQAWEKMGGLCQAMARALREAAAGVTERWPPERSEAARAFSDRLHLLADAFEKAQHASYINGPNLNGLQLDSAIFRCNIGTLIKEYAATHDRAIQRGKELHVQRAASAQTEDNLLAMSNLPAHKDRIDQIVGPVPNDWKLQFERMARQYAAEYESAVSQYRRTFQPPQPVPPTLRTPATGGGTGFGGDGGGSYLASLGLPIGQFANRPGPPSDGEPDLDGGPMNSGPMNTGPMSGPILDGGHGGGSAGAGGYPVGGSNLPVPTGGAVPWVATPTGYAMAPGGVIGEPGRGAHNAAARAAAGGTVPIVGAGAAARLASTGTGGFVAPPGGMIAGRPPHAGRGAPVRSPGDVRRHPNDEEAFVVPRGAPAVLRAPDDPDDHRPGPGVIGIDR